jgi:sulfotransferase family protein
LHQAESVKTLRKQLKSKKQEHKRIRREAKEKGKKAERRAHKRRKKLIEQEIFRLENEIRAAKEGWAAEDDSTTGALPDFAVIGTMKGGTSFFYHLLSQHPLVQPAAAKELHFFDAHFDLGVEWYRRCFPAPRLEDGRRTITGEATPYMSHRLAPERMAKVVPEARLIALLRNPVERTYSDYQQVVRKGRETLTFEEAIGAAEKARSSGRGGRSPELEDRAGLDRHGYFSRSIYVDKLLRWSEFFPREQMLVLKSEDFFENPRKTLKSVLEFLGLPEWEPEPSKLENKRNAGRYEEEMDPVTRRRLEEYFEPHNRRLYDYLGVDFGW